MKNSTYFRFFIHLILGIFFIIMFTSYGNKKVHPDINEMIVRAFLNRNKLSATQTILPAFKKYNFTFDIDRQCKGVAVIKDGFFHTEDVVGLSNSMGDNIHYHGANILDLGAVLLTDEEGDAEMSTTQWIAHGGFAADVPEVPASLRHFYDPTRNPGERYLTDNSNGIVTGLVQKLFTNPKIDGVDWALGRPGDLSFNVQDHAYTWEKGKAWMRMALQEKNVEKRSVFLGKAWRSLGETLHMIADNGCPCHVRNDAHPSPLMKNNTWFGNPDPYEELVDLIRLNKPEEFASFSKGTPDPDLKNKLDSMKNVRDIAHQLALYTNENFVTNETISGKDKNGTNIAQITHPQYTYPAPLLDKMNYEQSDYSYSSPSGVKQCVDLVYFAKVIPHLCAPYVDEECVKSQARVLIPNIIEAGVDVMQLFIPKFKIEVQPAGKGGLEGVIKHITDIEYPAEIRYNGEVSIVILDKSFKKKDEFTVNAENGLFKANGLKLKDGDKAYAKINFGGVSVESDQVNLIISDIPVVGSKWVFLEINGLFSAIGEKSPPYNFNKLDFSQNDDGGTGCDYTLKWNNIHFSNSFNCKFRYMIGSFVGTVSGEVTTANTCNLSVQTTTVENKCPECTQTKNFCCTIRDIPFHKIDESDPIYQKFVYKAEGPDIAKLISVLKSNYSYTDKTNSISSALDKTNFDNKSYIKISFFFKRPVK